MFSFNYCLSTVILALLLLLSDLADESAAAFPTNSSSSLRLPQTLTNETRAVLRNGTLRYNPPREPEYLEDVDANHALRLGDGKHTQPERDFLAALVAAENRNMENFIGGGGNLRVLARSIEYRRFGVRIFFDNPDRMLSYDLIGDMLEALAAFIWNRKVTEVNFSLVDMTDGGVVISNGGVEQFGPFNLQDSR